jgi:hypothetical protein
MRYCSGGGTAEDIVIRELDGTYVVFRGEVLISFRVRGSLTVDRHVDH